MDGLLMDGLLMDGLLMDGLLKIWHVPETAFTIVEQELSRAARKHDGIT
jgi:hypothetical protein